MMVERLVSYGKQVPNPTEELAPHVVIRNIRNTLHMTQAQLARRAEMPQSHLAKIETGKVDVQLSTLRRILRALNCEAVFLPKFHKAPQEVLRERIREVARRKVARVAGTMALERQRPDERMVRALIRSEEERLLARPTSEVWEDTWAQAGASVVRDEAAVKSRRAQMPVRIVDKEDDRDTLRFWLEQPVEARIDAMEFLRRQTYLTTGNEALPRFQHVIQLRGRE
ncbi:MAG: helix-turn-helix domain-containing protein [Elusimicrobia bacterium]|nr:helix-turn-helix domain-containing protein [Elusimicrobiota bacterium]